MSRNILLGILVILLGVLVLVFPVIGVFTASIIDGIICIMLSFGCLFTVSKFGRKIGKIVLHTAF